MAKKTKLWILVSVIAVVVAAAVTAGAIFLPGIFGWDRSPADPYVKWYSEEETEYVITTVDQLYDMAYLSSKYDFEGQTFVLGADLVINDGNASDWIEAGPARLWYPINGFAGTFDGQGHTISGLYGVSYNDYMGLFANTTRKAVVKDLKVVNSLLKTSGKHGTGVISANGGGTFTGIYTDAIIIADNWNIGGIIGKIDANGDSLISNCWFAGQMILKSDQGRVAGGMVGDIMMSNGIVTIEHCLSTGSFSSPAITNTSRGRLMDIGGIVGRASSGTTNITDCFAAGKFDVDCTNGTGVIIGSAGKGTTNISHTYAANETYVNRIGYRYNKTVGDVYPYAMKYLTGYEAYKWTTLDFEEYWAVDLDGTPILKTFATEVPSLEGIEREIDTSWYTKIKTYTIKNWKQLLGLHIVSQWDSLSGKIINLGADIVINEGDASEWRENAPAITWKGIGSANTMFAGTFDGCGFSVSGAYRKEAANGIGFFPALGDGALVRNFRLVNSYFESNNVEVNKQTYSYIGSIAGFARGATLDTVYSNAIVVNDGYFAGGLIGLMRNGNATNVLNSWFDGRVIMHGEQGMRGGGLVAVVWNTTLNMSHCLMTGVMTGESKAYGANEGIMVGYPNAKSVVNIEDSLNVGSLTIYEGKPDGNGMMCGRIAADASVTMTNVFSIKGKNNDKYISDWGLTGYRGAEPVFNGAAVLMDGKYLRGYAGYQYTSLDFENYWAVDPYGYPKLQAFMGADETAPDVSGFGRMVDYSWYNSTEDYYYLSNRRQLLGFTFMGSAVTFKDKTITLTNDIAINSGDATTWGETPPAIEWLPIGNATNMFMGTFNGGGHTISGIYVKEPSNCLGLFATVREGTVKNLRLTNSYIESNASADSKAKGKYSNYNYIGAIASYAYGATFDTIYTDAILKNDGEMTGGIVGLANRAGTTSNFNNCWFDGTIIQDFSVPKNDGSVGAAFAGGIIGLLRNSSANITHCLSTATFAPINLPDGAWGTVTGGIVGRFDSNDFTRNDTLVIRDTLGAPDFQMPMSTQGGNGSVVSQINPNTRVVLENVYGTGGWKPIATNRSNTLSTGETRDEKDPGTVGTAENVQLPRMTGANALLFSKLDFDKYWVAVEGTTPELKSFSTGKKADPKDAYDDRIPDISWYSSEKTEFVITNTAQMRGFAELSKTKDFAGQTIKLGADIAFNYGTDAANMLVGANIADGVDAWTPIGTKITPFRGVFDGQGHTVSGLANSNTGHSALFAFVDDAFIQNVTVDRSIFRGGSGGGTSAGIVANTAGDTTIRRVRVTENVRLYIATYNAGIVAYNSGNLTMDNVWSAAFTNPQWAGNAYVGGILGANANNTGMTVKISNALYTGTMAGTVAGTSFVGGLVGASMNNPVTTITDSLVDAKIQVIHGGEAGQMYIGAVIGSKSWTEGNTIFEDVYATNQSVPVCELVDGALAETGEFYGLIREDQTIETGATMVERDDILGNKAKKNAPGLDYEKVWMIVEGKTPELRHPASGEKTPKPITTPNKTPVDMTWYNTTDKVFVMKDIADLNGLSLLSQTNTFEGITIKLAKDMILNTGDASDWEENAPDNKWIPIGNATYRFKGTFDGQGHTISGIYLVDNGTDGGSAMFGCIDGATIKNFKIVNSFIKDSTAMTDAQVWGRVGSVVGTAYSGTVENVYSDANLSGAAMFNGGIVALYRAPRVGGVIVESNLVIRNCWYNGVIDLGTNGRAAGGILGGATDGLADNVDQTKLTIENCLFSGEITGSFNGTEPAIGGIFGRVHNTSAIITDCLVTGSLNVNTIKYVGSAYGYKNYGVKIAFTDVYVCEESSHVAYIGVAHNTTNANVANIAIVKRDDILGDAAKDKLTGLDFEKTWSAKKENTPVLKAFDDETPMEPVQIPDAPSLKPDTSWYNNTDTEFVITTPEQLLGLAELSRINTFAGKTIKLGADIIFNEGVASGNLLSGSTIVFGVQPWTPIGSNVMPFRGVFDGMGHKVAGLVTVSGHASLFAYTEDAFVQNITVERSTFKGGSGGTSAGIIANAGGNTTVKRAFVTGSVNLYGATNIGGIVGTTFGTGTITVDNVWANHYVNPQWIGNAFVGGIVGSNSNTALKLNVSNALYTGRMAGTVAGTSFVGGLIGASMNNPVTTVTDSLAAGNILVLHGGATGTMYTGSVIASKSWTDANTVMTDVYATENCFPVGEVVDGNVAATEENYGVIREDQTIASGVTVVKTEDILGELAKKNAPGLDYVKVWMTVEEQIPTLRNPASGEPTPKPITDVEETEVDISWYDSSKTEFVLMDVADLNGFALLSQNNTFEGVTIKLGADISLNNGNAADWATNAPASSWTPIGSVTYRFKGTFDGQGHTISGLYVNDSASDGGQAMFSCIDGATIKNFKLVNSYFASSDAMTAGEVWGRVGSIVGTAYSGTVENVYSDAYLSGRAMFNGGIIGLYRAPRVAGTVVESELVIRNCWYNGIIELGDTGRAAGGILGGANDGLATNVDQTKLTIENCHFSGEIRGNFNGAEPCIGGIFGRAINTNAAITDCLVTGSLNVNTIKYTGSAYGYKNYGVKIAITDLYVAEETAHVTHIGVEHNKINATVENITVVKRAEILGDAAKDKLTGLDFADTWTVVKDNVPVLKAFADETPMEPVQIPDAPSVKPDTSWYNDTDTEFVISTPAQLLGLAELSRIETFAGKTIKLGADIIFNEGTASGNLLDSAGKPVFGVQSWSPIGSSVMPFRGVFDGMGHKIAGLAAGAGHAALFAYTEDAFVQNITVERSTFKGGSGGTSAGIIANAGGNTTVKRAFVTGSVNLYNATNIGGIIGKTFGTGTITVDNVWANHYVNPQWIGSAFVGGIIGSNSNTELKLNVSNALYTGRMAGTVAGESFVGGLIGASMNKPVTTVTDSLAAGNILVLHGGATGKMYAGSVIASKSWTDANTVMTDVYATENCFPVGAVVDGNVAATESNFGTIREDQTLATGVKVVKTEDILGDLAKDNAPGLDYVNVWTTAEGMVPQLRNPASGEPTPAPSTEVEKTEVDISWYDADKTEFVLMDAADLNGFALLSQNNSFDGVTIKLGADIVLNVGNAATWATTAPDAKWTPIGNVTYRFKGTFDGQGYTISGLYAVDSGAETGEAMFTCIDGATIKNFKLENSYIKSSVKMTDAQAWSRVAAIVGTAYSGTIENVYSDALLSGEAMFNGGIVGLYRATKVSGVVQETELTIRNCWYNGTLNLLDHGRSAGGILGGVTDGDSTKPDQMKLTIENCLFSGEIAGNFNATEPAIGGVIGRIHNANATVTDCLVSGSLNVNTIKYTGSAYGFKNYSAKINITDLYVAEETSHVTHIGIEHNTVNATVANIIVVKRADIIGDLAKTNASGLDYADVWTVLETNVPVLKAFADKTPMEPVQIPDAPSLTPDTSWYNTTDTEFVITTPEQLLGLAELSKTKDFAGITIKLGADIIFNEGIASGNLINGSNVIFGVQRWTAIGTKLTPFRGVFDGMGHKIAGLAETGTGNSGLFAYVEDAFVQNVTIERSTFRGGSGGGKSAALIANAGGNTTVKRVFVTGSVNLYHGTYIGGIIAETYGTGTITVDNVWVNHYVNPQWASGAFVGGVIGRNSNNAGLKLNLSNVLYTGRMSGTVAGESFVGGLIGASMNNPITTVTDSLAAGNILVLHGGATGKMYAGSLIGSKSWTDANTVMTDVYATENCFSVAEVVDGNVVASATNYGTIRDDQSFASGVKVVKTEEILGELAKTNAPGLDYVNIWTTAEEMVPQLRNPASGEPTPTPITEPDNTPVDTSWYNDTDTEFVLMDAADLNGFARLAQGNTFAGKTIKLGADIVLNTGDAATWATVPPAYKWAAIGTQDSRFKGTFDGQGHTISGMYYSGNASSVALFGCIEGATIKNFKLTNTYLKSTESTNGTLAWSNMASIVSVAYGGTVSDIYTDAYISGGSMNNGGIVGIYRTYKENGAAAASELAIINCWFDGELDLAETGRSSGGILGGVVEGPSGKADLMKVTIQNVLMTGYIHGSFVGEVDANITNTKITATGGLIGNFINCTPNISDVLIAGEMDMAAGATYVGSVYGYKNYGVAAGTTADIYVTEEMHDQYFHSAGHNSTTWAITKVKEAKLVGGLARLYATGLDFSATGKWIAVKDAMPELRDFSTGIEAPVLDEDPDAPKSIKPDTSWYNDTDTVFVIDTIEELFGFAKLTNEGNSFAGKTVKLDADLTLNTGNAADWATTAPTYSWTPIAKGTFFEGTFDGQGHTISGLYAKNEDNSYATFIAQIKGATVKNFKVVNSYFESVISGTLDNTAHFHAITAIVGRANKGSLIEGIYTDAILVGGRSAGLVGHGDDTASDGINIKNCWFAGSITVNVTIPNADAGRGTGGILGQAVNGKVTTLENCLFTGTITGGKQYVSIGGLVGSGPWNATVKLINCLSAGTISGVDGAAAGSVIGNNPGSNKATYTAVYATADTYTALAGANGTLSGFTATTVAKADILGGLARWNLTGFDFTATGAWIAVENKIPELRQFSTATDAPAVPNPVTPPADPNAEDTTWFNTTDTEFTLTTVGQVKGFVTLAKTNNFAGKTIKLGADIVWNTGDAATYATTAPANVWTPIGSTSMKFAGTFDGQNYTISGLYFDNETGSASVGMFAAVESATIKNLKVANSFVKSTAGSSYVGILVGTASGVTIENVYVGDDVTAMNGVHSGVVAYADGTNAVTFKKVWMNGTITSGMWRSRTAGLLGSTANTNGLVITIEDCLFTGTVAHTHATTTDENYAGGFAGGIPANVKITVKNSLSAGTITVATTSANTLGGSLIGVASWRGAAYTTFENAYATTECHANVTYRGASTYTGTPVQVAKAEILGDLATSKLTGLDFTNTWTTVEDYVPVLKAFVAFAPEPFDPTAEDTSWYNDTDTEFVLTTVGQVKGFVTLAKTNNFAGKTIKLGADIVWNTGDAATYATTAPANVWTPIGSTSMKFAGTFDGQNYTISGLYFDNETGSASVGMFAAVESATIKNLKVANSFVKSTAGSSYVGILVGTASGVTIENVYVGDDVTAMNGVHSGVVAYADGANAVTFKKVWMNGTVTSGMWRSRTAGLLGSTANTNGLVITIEDCLFTGTVTHTHATTTDENYAGGFAGGIPANVKITVKNSLSAGTITVATTSANTLGGSLIGVASWRGAAYTTFENAYATTECHANVTYRAASSYTGTPVQVAKANLLGNLAKTNAPNLDYVNTWIVVDGKTPELRAFSTATEPDPEATVNGITVTPPTKSQYLVGESLVLDGMVVTATYTDSTTKVLTDGYTVSTLDSSTAGTKTITVTYGTFTATFQVTVVDPSVETTAWYDASKTEFTLNTLGELKGFVTLTQTNTFEGKTVKLGTDIVWNELGDGEKVSDWATNAPANVWTPIADTDNGFKGVFDGQGHTVSGLYVKNTKYAAFFARVYGATAAVKNVNIVDSYFESSGTGDSFHNGAGIIGRANNDATISGIYTNAFFKGVKGVGLVAFADSVTTCNIANCWFDGTIDVTGATNVGGFVGLLPNNATFNIDNCLFTGTMTGTAGSSAYIGGLVGIGAYNTSVIANNCLVAGDMTAITAGITGSVIGNNPGNATKPAYTNVYATTETHANLAGANAGTTAFASVKAFAKADILGDAAKTKLTGFDFTDTWMTVANSTPVLKAFVAFAPEVEAKVNGITVTAPTKTQYLVGESLVTDGMVVTATYTDSTTKVLTDGYTVSTLDSSTAGTKTITVTYGTFTATFQVTVTDPNAVDTSWYNETDTTFTLTTAGQLKGLAELAKTNQFIGKTVKLGADITFNSGSDASTWGTTAPDYEWTPIGGSTDATAFKGHFDGQNHTISGLYSKYESRDTNGFFGGVKNGSVKNLKITNSYFENATTDAANLAQYACSGSVAGFVHNVVIENVESSAIIKSNCQRVGGLVGRQDDALTMTNCTFSGQVIGTGAANEARSLAYGGLVGYTNSVKTSEIKNCTVSGSVSADYYVGGFVGQVNGASGAEYKFTDCTFTGSSTAIGGSSHGAYNGGFVGNIGSTGYAVFSGCKSAGTVTNTTQYYAGGFVGFVSNNANSKVSLDRCVSTSTVTAASSNVGGLIGRTMTSTGYVSITNTVTTGAITGSGHSFCQIIGNNQAGVDVASNNFYLLNAGGNVTGAGFNAPAAPIVVTDKIAEYIAEQLLSGMTVDYDGFVSSGFMINDAADLYGFNVYNQANGFAGKTAKLGADITINTLEAGKTAADWATKAPKYNWTPVGGIGGAAGAFAGTFDGQGYTISGLYCALASGNSMGMFREVTGTVTNFKLVDSYLANTVTSTWGYNGTIASYLTGGTISKVYTNAIVETTGSYAGGIVGVTSGATATVSECQFDGTLNARCYVDKACDATNADQSREHANHVGGIIGAVTATNTNVSDCIFSGMIINTCNKAHRTGGIVGGAPAAGKSTTITKCFSIGEFRADANSYHFSMIMDLRQGTSNTTLTNLATVFADNYVLTQQLYNMDGTEKLNSGSNLTGCNKNSGVTVPSTVRNTEAEMIARIKTEKEAGTCPLDFENVWVYEEGKLPTLKAFATND